MIRTGTCDSVGMRMYWGRTFDMWWMSEARYYFACFFEPSSGPSLPGGDDRCWEQGGDGVGGTDQCEIEGSGS